MSLSLTKRQRLKQIAQEVREILAEGDQPQGPPITFAEIENEAIEAGDLLTACLIEQRVTQREPQQEAACCPTCQRQGERLPEDEPRVLQTDRGEVAWIEPAYYCRPCRRSFFPSLG